MTPRAAGAAPRARSRLAVFTEVVILALPMAGLLAGWGWSRPFAPAGLAEAASLIRKSAAEGDLVLVVGIAPQDADASLRGLPFVVVGAGWRPPEGFERYWLVDAAPSRSALPLPGLPPRLWISEVQGLILSLHISAGGAGPRAGGADRPAR
jgi:hypothetical protein